MVSEVQHFAISIVFPYKTFRSTNKVEFKSIIKLHVFTIAHGLIFRHVNFMKYFNSVSAHHTTINNWHLNMSKNLVTKQHSEYLSTPSSRGFETL